MQYLLDTPIILWWLNEPKKLSDKIRQIIANKDNKIFVSSVSFWEMAIKKEVGKLSIPSNILSILHIENIQILPVTAEECLGMVDLPKMHKDPFDRILVVQAKLNDLIFITNDPHIAQYPIVTIS